MVKCCIAVQVQSSVAASSCGVSMERNQTELCLDTKIRFLSAG